MENVRLIHCQKWKVESEENILAAASPPELANGKFPIVLGGYIARRRVLALKLRLMLVSFIMFSFSLVII